VICFSEIVYVKVFTHMCLGILCLRGNRKQNCT